MRKAELVADGDVISYMFKGTPLGESYSALIGPRKTGITLLAVSESRQGVVYRNWGMKKLQELDAFLSDFILLESNGEIANLCGALLGRCMQVGRALSWPDAWAAATAIWLDVPLVAHDWDLEKIPGLKVLTIHEHWEVREEGIGVREGGPLWLGQRSPGYRPSEEWA
jgi:predicted nucleic acid-binding protein